MVPVLVDLDQASDITGGLTSILSRLIQVLALLYIEGFLWTLDYAYRRRNSEQKMLPSTAYRSAPIACPGSSYSAPSSFCGHWADNGQSICRALPRPGLFLHKEQLYQYFYPISVLTHLRRLWTQHSVNVMFHWSSASKTIQGPCRRSRRFLVHDCLR
ncbi:hypothetical protein DFH07DRAFT_172011 [Mycena maculata]|uniref:Uncharacterized protein n=1 Tax=Mycena maculata TaxID=230809 RepID=A0AAD7JVJ2_9AGAR|nr:hypothetical protein DFH07DRAFT_172011 [Mycena maculata]